MDNGIRIDITLTVLAELVKHIIAFGLKDIEGIAAKDERGQAILEWAKRSAVKLTNENVLNNESLLRKNSISIYRFAGQLVREMKSMGVSTPSLQEIDRLHDAFSVDRTASTVNWFAWVENRFPELQIVK